MPITFWRPDSNRSFCPIVLFLSVTVLLLGPFAGAQGTGLPYTTRTHPYQGWSALVKGDNNTIGMAGASTALPTGISSMEMNPAGAAMYLNGLAALINKNSIDAPQMNHTGESITEYQWGVGTSIQPWGFGLAYYSPASENAPGAEVSVRQLRLSVSRMLGRKLSLGASIEWVRAIRDIGGTDLGTGWVSSQFGALYKLEDNWVVGASVKPGIDIGPWTGPAALP